MVPRFSIDKNAFKLCDQYTQYTLLTSRSSAKWKGIVHFGLGLVELVRAHLCRLASVFTEGTFSFRCLLMLFVVVVVVVLRGAQFLLLLLFLFR